MSLDAHAPLRAQSAFLSNAENHIGDTIQTLREMQNMEQQDVEEAAEQRHRFLLLAKEMDDRGLAHLATVARDGAELEAAQMDRNVELVKRQGMVIGLLQAVAGGVAKFAKFFHTFSRALSGLQS